MADTYESRRAKRTRLTPLVMLASGVVVAAIAVVPAYMLSAADSRTADQGTASVASAGQFAPEPIEKIWPEAVYEVPRRLADGSKVRPRLALDSTHLLLTSEASHEKADALYSYNLNSAKTTKLADIPIPDGTTLFPDGFAVGDGQIAWWTARGEQTKTADFWTVSRDGGKAQLITSVVLPPASPAGRVTGIAVTSKGLFWSVGNDGVFTVEGAGKAPQQVKGTQRQHILSWPWIGSPGSHDPRRVPFQSVMNVETGERRDRLASDAGTAIACGISLCVTHPGGSAAMRVLGRDGKAQRDMDMTGVHPQPLQRDRFLFAHLPDRALVHDVRTGLSAEISDVDTRVRYRMSAGSNVVLFNRGDNYVIVNLASIP
ncbi:hypothetical protein [Nonomuraea sp. B5E05]|uniref:hypothetical protein n=1 Tax=Nonomuraea sp. B5E05 TaxID=3153569 RepID=UPI003260BD53